MKPTISILGSAARPNLWLDWYKSIGDNQIPFEVIFVGPNRPNFQLPDNFYFIESHVKPMQCIEIAARNASGECLIPVADDMFFEPPNPLGTLYTDFLSYNTEKLMLSCRLRCSNAKDSVKTYDKAIHFPGGTTTEDVVMPAGFLMYNSYYKYLGGADVNFIATYFDVDLCFRVIEDGGITKLSDIYTVEHVFRCDTTKSLYAAYHIIDREITLKRLWPMLDINTEFKRSAVLEPYMDNNILTESQGPKGKWV